MITIGNIPLYVLTLRTSYGEQASPIGTLFTMMGLTLTSLWNSVSISSMLLSAIGKSSISAIPYPCCGMETLFTLIDLICMWLAQISSYIMSMLLSPLQGS